MYRISESAQRIGRSAANVRRWERGLYCCCAHRDRLSRFGFDYREYVTKKDGRTILVAHQEPLSPQEETVQELLAIVHTFSYRLHGLCKYAKALKSELAGGGR